MEPIRVIRDKSQAATLLQGERRRLLGLLRRPASASALAKKLRAPRQKINYHLRALEKSGLVRLVEERKARNCTERIVQATARAYVISPEVLAELGMDAEEPEDRFSSAYLVSLAARAIGDLGWLREQAQAAGKRLATLSLETEIRFASAAERNAFAEELTAFTARLAAKYHDAEAPNGRPFRLISAVYPAVDPNHGVGEKPAEEESNE